MRTTRIALVIGAAALAVAGCTGIAAAQASQTNVMTLRLPDGQVEQVLT